MMLILNYLYFVLINFLFAILHLAAARYLKPFISSFENFVLEFVCRKIYTLLHEPLKGIKYQVAYNMACQITTKLH